MCKRGKHNNQPYLFFGGDSFSFPLPLVKVELACVRVCVCVSLIASFLHYFPHARDIGKDN